jgi:hypothetical protein
VCIDFNYCFEESLGHAIADGLKDKCGSRRFFQSVLMRGHEETMSDDGKDLHLEGDGGLLIVY